MGLPLSGTSTSFVRCDEHAGGGISPGRSNYECRQYTAARLTVIHTLHGKAQFVPKK
jgi:hypothetical protein